MKDKQASLSNNGSDPGKPTHYKSFYRPLHNSVWADHYLPYRPFQMSEEKKKGFLFILHHLSSCTYAI